MAPDDRIASTTRALCLADLLRAQAQRAPEAIAVTAPGRAPLTYARLWAQVEETVGALNALGVGRHDRVAMVLPQGPEMAVAFVAVAAGATCAPLNPGYREREFAFYLADLRARLLVAQAGMASPARAVARARAIPVLELSPLPGAEAGRFTLRGGSAAGPAPAGFAPPGDVALVLHTSGTTARPKLVPLTQSNVCASARNLRTALALHPCDRYLNVMPLFHIHGLMMTLSSLLAGAGVGCAPAFDATRFFAWLAELAPTCYSAAPTIHQAILARAASHHEIIAQHPLRFIRSSAAPLPPQVMVALERAFGAPVIEGYGQTESALHVASNPLPPGRRKAGSVGLAAGPELAIMDEAGTFLPSEAIGEIVIRGANVTAGYEHSPATNAAAFTAGWFRTGDRGFLDAEGYLFITGRFKELINRGGEKISPREVDEVLLDHPAVAQVVTFAVPHPTLGEEVAAAVVLRPGTATMEREVREFAARRLADYKVPRQVVFLDDIPKGPSGKPERFGMAEKLGLLTGEAARPRGGIEFVTPRTHVEEMLAEIWRRVIGASRVGIRDDFFQLGGNSLLAADVFAEIAKTFGRQLPLDTLFRAATVEGLAAILGEDGSRALRSGLVPIQAGGSCPPLFCVHQHTGQLFCYQDLARHLGPTQPVYGLAPHGLDGLEPPCDRIEKMATAYVGEIRRLQPQGPYHLAGYCLGGTVAFEMAHHLLAQGERVALLALIEATRRDPATRLQEMSRRIQRRFSYEGSHLAGLPVRGTLIYAMSRGATVVREAGRRFLTAAREQVRRGVKPLSPVERAIKNVEVAHDEALRHYAPRVYPGRMVLFRKAKLAARHFGDPYLGWGGLAAGGIDVHEIPGERPTILEEPPVRILAERLRACLAAARGDGDVHA